MPNKLEIESNTLEKPIANKIILAKDKSSRPVTFSVYF